MVERKLPKLEVASSNLVARSRRESRLLQSLTGVCLVWWLIVDKYYKVFLVIPAPFVSGRLWKVGFARFFLCLMLLARETG